MNNNIVKLNIDPKILDEFTQGLRKTFELMQVLPKYLKMLADLGWFISLDLTPGETKTICNYLDESNIEALNQFLIKDVDNNLEAIKIRAINDFPKRKEIFEAIFQAHLNKNYSLSIPVLLSQIDGICFETLNVSFYSKTNKKPKTKIRLESLTFDEILDIYLTPMKNSISISSNKNDIDYQIGNFNRHEIVHGISTNYGTEINSYKAFSLLNYIIDMSKEIKSHKG
ncbi:MAG: hypothetical protein HQ521_02545 [Bacteroidetes bacterium]|nr:hypothetical protein [Bacteroidota bacterium]